MEKRSRGFFPIHPVLLGLYPLLSLLAYNLQQVQLKAAVRAAVVSLIVCSLLYLILRLILKDTGRAAVLSSLWLLLFYSYGQVYQLIEGKTWLGVVYGKHRFLIAVWLVIFLAGSWLVLKKLTALKNINQILNIVSIFLLIYPIFQIGSFAYQYQRINAAVQNSKTSLRSQATSGSMSTSQAQEGPDIYYIILDGYSRADVLKNLYNLDITPFMDELKSMGFVFPDCAQSNYGMTPFSMFSSLNMDYMDNYPDAFPAGSTANQVDTNKIYKYIRQNQVRQFLEQRGYRIVTAETDYWWLNIDNADVYVVANNNPLVKYNEGYEITGFEEMYIRTTALRILTETGSWFSNRFSKHIFTPNQRRYEMTRFQLNQLEKIPELPGKKFTYFHIAAPHSPFVIDANGNFVDYDDRNGDVPGYPNQIIYLNKRMIEIIRSLIASSKVPPIIVLQADHGWDLRYRMPILNAYYLPNGGNKFLYPTITPVNTFRLIFNYYFGANYKFLKDASYFSIGGDITGHPYQLTPVPDTCMGSTK